MLLTNWKFLSVTYRDEKYHCISLKISLIPTFLKFFFKVLLKFCIVIVPLVKKIWRGLKLICSLKPRCVVIHHNLRLLTTIYLSQHQWLLVDAKIYLVSTYNPTFSLLEEYFPNHPKVHLPPRMLSYANKLLPNPW